MQLLTKKDIDVPKTVCARTPDSVDAGSTSSAARPAIVKLQQGTQGIGTMIAETPQAVTSLLETLWAMGQDIILQEYIAESKGARLPRHRRRRPGRRGDATPGEEAGEFRSNLHRGGLGVRVELPTGATAQAAIAAAKVMGLEVAGVDMLEGSDGPKILEINSSPGLEGIERTSGIDVAGAIIAHAEQFLAKRKKRRVQRRDAVIDGERRMRTLAYEAGAGLSAVLRVGAQRRVVAVWTIDRPGAKNALDHETLDHADARACEAAAKDRTLRAVVLTGAGHAFVSGGDLRELRDIGREATRSDLPMPARRSARCVELPFPVDCRAPGLPPSAAAPSSRGLRLRVADMRAKSRSSKCASA